MKTKYLEIQNMENPESMRDNQPYQKRPKQQLTKNRKNTRAKYTHEANKVTRGTRNMCINNQ